MHGNWFTECQGLAASFGLFPVSSFSATPLGVIAQVHQDSTFAHKTECGQEYSFLSLGLWPCSLSRFLLHAVVRDVGPEGSAPNDKPEGPAADDKPEGPGADDKLDRFDIHVSCALVPQPLFTVEFM